MQKKIKVACIGGRDIHKLGGIESYMMNLCSKLVELGAEPIVYCESSSDKEEMVNGFKVIHWKAPKSMYVCKIGLGLKSTLNVLMKQTDVEIIHYNAWPPSLWSWLARLFGKKTIMMGHGLEWKRTKYSPTKQKIMRFMECMTANMNTNLLMVSEEQTDWFAKAYHKRAMTIPCAVNLPSLYAPDSRILEKFGLENNGYYLYLGRLVQDKNPDYLIKAFISSYVAKNGVKLVIAGSNDAKPDYVESLHKLAGGNPNVVFTGAVYGEDKETLLRRCKVFCIPSTIEGLAITLLEAMSYAKPVIASDIPSNREGLADNGIWVKAEDVDTLTQQIQYCEKNITALELKATLNRKRVEENYTWDIVAQKYLNFLTSLCPNRNKIYP